MNVARQKIVALLLAALYGTVGVFGYSLHALVPCGDALCGVDDDSHGCDCAFHAQSASTNSDEPTLADSRYVHNSADCVVCSLLAQLKAGHVDLPPPMFGVQTTGELTLTAHLDVLHTFFLATLSRGPPVCS